MNEKYTLINKNYLCNLSRYPVSYTNNPLYKTAKQILKKKNLKFKDSFLFKHYKKIKKTKIINLATLYNKKSGNLNKIPISIPLLPWIHNSIKFSFTGDAFICTKINFYRKSFSKLKKIISSIQEKGFVFKKKNLNRDSGITGYFLKNKKKKKFFIIRGNHRVAAFIAIYPQKKIPVILEKFEYLKEKEKQKNQLYEDYKKKKNLNKNFPFEFDVKHSLKWKVVLSNFIDKKSAELIFKSYTDLK